MPWIYVVGVLGGYLRGSPVNAHNSNGCLFQGLYMEIDEATAVKVIAAGL